MASTNAVVSAAATSLPTTTETAVLTFTIPAEANPTGQGVMIDVTAVFTAGTATTSIQCRVRQGSGTGGAIVGNLLQDTATAAITNAISGCVLDATLAYPAGNTYTVTMQQVAATGAGTMQYVCVNTTPCTSLLG